MAEMVVVEAENLAKLIKGDKGDTGGYYVPSVSTAGVLSWEASADEMPTITSRNIKGAKGDKGDTGDNGVSPTVEVSKTGKVTTLTFVDAEGTKTATILDGADGTGAGSGGADGFSPVVVITSIDGGNRVTITDAYGTNSFDVMNGVDGQDGNKGDKGDAGYTPVRGTDYWTAADKAEIVTDVLSALPNASGVSF